MHILSDPTNTAPISFKVWGFSFLPKGSPIGIIENGTLKTIAQPEDIPRKLRMRINKVTYEFNDDDITEIENVLALIKK